MNFFFIQFNASSATADIKSNKSAHRGLLHKSLISDGDEANEPQTPFPPSIIGFPPVRFPEPKRDNNGHFGRAATFFKFVKLIIVLPLHVSGPCFSAALFKMTANILLPARSRVNLKITQYVTEKRNSSRTVRIVHTKIQLVAPTLTR